MKCKKCKYRNDTGRSPYCNKWKVHLVGRATLIQFTTSCHIELKR